MNEIERDSSGIPVVDMVTMWCGAAYDSGGLDSSPSRTRLTIDGQVITVS
jgi:hypothetical protein